MREGDLPYLAKNLRSADLREMVATFGNTRHLHNLTRSVAVSSHTRVAVNDNDDPIMIWGCGPYKDAGIIWACATREIVPQKRRFLRQSQDAVAELFRLCPHSTYLINFTHGKNVLHHRWLEWCGAELLPAVPFGPLGEPFRPFVIRRDTIV